MASKVLFGSNPLLATDRPTEVPTGTLLGQSGNNLVVVNAQTGFSAVLGQPTILGFGLAYDAVGTLFIADGSMLRTYDPISGASADIGPFGGLITVAELAYNPHDRLLYGGEFGAQAGQLVRIDPTTGAAQRIGTGPDRPRVHALTFTRADAGTNGLPRHHDRRAGGALADDRRDRSRHRTGGIRRRVWSDARQERCSLRLHERVGDREPASDDRCEHWRRVPAAAIGRPLYGLTVTPCPAPCFAAPVTVSLSIVDIRPGIAVRDMDGDSRMDVVTIQQNSGQLVLLPGQGDGTFQAPRFFATSGLPTGLAVADLNNDGHPDVVTAHRFAQVVSVMLSDGAGGFLPGVDYGVGGPSFGGFVVADLTSDGFLDIAAGVGGSVALLVGNGAGQFVPGSLTGASATSITAIAAGDLDGDTSMDIVTTHFNGTVAVLFGDGTGQFPRSAHYALASFPVSVEVGDLNGDGKPDVALIDSEGGDAVTVALNDGSGVLMPGIPYFSGDPNHPEVRYRPAVVRIADLTGDGRPDLVTANDPRSVALRSVSMLNGTGSGAFRSAQRSPFKVAGSVRVAAGDLNGDGLLDVATSNSLGVTVLMNQQSF